MLRQGVHLDMEVDSPCAKRRRVGPVGALWWEAPAAIDEETSSLLWSLCDALALYTSAAGGGVPGLRSGSLPEDVAAAAAGRPSALWHWPRPTMQRTLGRALRGTPGCAADGVGLFAAAAGCQQPPRSPDSCSSNGSQHHFAGGGGISPLQAATNSPSPERAAQVARSTGSAVGRPGARAAPGYGIFGAGTTPPEAVVQKQFSGEPLLRALTQLANMAAIGSLERRHLVSECQVHLPLLRLMQGPWARQPLVAERCCRLLHWLCVRAPENREVLAAHRSPCTLGGARSVSFVDAALAMAEAHPQRREVLAHALRALAALLPCPRVREELLRSQPRLLTCLVQAGEALDAAAIRSVCRWLPGVSSQVRQARNGRQTTAAGGAGAASASQQPGAEPALHGDDDVEMADL